MPRATAPTEVKALVAQAIARQAPLSVIATEAFPNLPTGLFDATSQLGEAPQAAQQFANRARKL